MIDTPCARRRTPAAPTALAALASLSALAACGYQGDPTRFQQHSEQSAETLEEAARELREAAADLRNVADRLEALGSSEVVVGSGGPVIDGGGPAVAAATYELDLPMTRYEWDPMAGDPSVPPELGGPGFTGEGWETNMEFPALGDPSAPQGGTMTSYLTDWPPTIRQAGKDWNTSFNYRANDLCMMRLATVHPITLEFIPQVATHWKISDDKRTYTYRINPEARFSDGTEVTAEDVVESWRLRVDPELLDPSSNTTYGKLNEPVAVSKYILEVTVREVSWRNFLYFSGMSIMPAREIGIGGEAYLNEYQFHFTACAGPYVIAEDEIISGQSITLRRNRDWWAEGNPAFAGLYNIESFKFVVVKDMNLAFEKAKKGELDYFIVSKAEWWARQIPELEQVQRGLIVRSKIFNDNPIGTSGFAINMKRPPLDDVRIRKALQLLHDRRTLIENLYFNEYEPLASYWQGGLYQNPDNEVLEYDPDGAVRLLEDAGWGELDDEGYRVKNGQRLSLEMTYRSPLSERALTDFQENCAQAGVEIKLQLLTPAAAWKNLREKKFELASTAWGALVFPNPETSWHSRLADIPDNNNVTGFADPRVDALCEEYETAYDVADRVRIVREVDGLVYHQHPYVLEHFNPARRTIFWNKFGLPKFGALRFADEEELMYCWWVDPEKEAALERAKNDPSITLEVPQVNNTFWREWNAAQ